MAVYHNVRGTVTYTIVGSPTIVDGVVSGFSASSYLRTTEQLPSPNKLEIIVSINTKTIPTNRNDWFIGCPSASTQNIVWGITSSKKMRLFLGSNGTSWDIANGATGTYSFSDDTSYLMRLTFDGQEYNAYISSDNGLSWVQDIKVTSSLQLSSQYIDIGINDRKGDYFWTGSIDLNNTYIMVNGQPWFGICPIEVKKHQVMGPVGYTVVGTPTITDGVASGFSRNNYLTAPINPQNVFAYEEVIRVKIPSTFTQRNYITGYAVDKYGWALSIPFGTKTYAIALAKSTSDTSAWRFDITTNVSPIYDQFYYIRFTWNGNTFLWEHSTNKENWSTIYSYNSSDFFYSSGNKLYGIGATNQSWYNDKFLEGEIDLNNTYIKVNGKLWFWQPQETKKIIVNGVEVYSKP